MKIPAVQPITNTQSRASRFQLGLTQSDVITQSGLPGHKLKQFETGRFVPDMPFLQKLADYYTGLGIDLSAAELPDPNAATATVLKPGSTMVRPAPMHRPHFYVSESVTPELLDQCLERMHSNDKRIAEILAKGLRDGLFGGFHEQTVLEHQELFGAMAEGYLIFRLLQGNPLVQPVYGKVSPKSHADLLGQFYAKSPVVLLEQIEELSDAIAEEVVK